MRHSSTLDIEMDVHKESIAVAYVAKDHDADIISLGISGTKGKEERPGLAALIQAIEVEAVYVVHISRVSRDQTLIDGLEFGELCKQHGVLIVMPTMRLNLRDAMHLRLYRQEIERAADEIELLKMRLGGPKKALSGRFDGRSVAPGYLIDPHLQSETYERYILYPPHAEVVRRIFQAVLATGTPTRAAWWLRDRGLIFPNFPPEVPSAAVSRSSLRRNAHPLRCPGGYLISPSLIRSIVTNPVYLGRWLVEGRVVSTDNHPPLIEEETFLLAQQVLADTSPEAGSRVLSAAQIATVKAFLADLRTGWDQQPPGLRHDFLRLILDRVVINTDREHVEATITWRTGAQQHLWIERPLIRRSGKVPWTEVDHAWLREYYATASREELQRWFPQRTYMAIRKQATALGLKRSHKGVPKPRGVPWDEAENALLRPYAAGQLSYAELQTQLPGRTWDGIGHQARVLGLRLQGKPVYCRLEPDVREIVSEEDSSRMV